MSYTLMVWNYVFFAVSFICFFTAARQRSKTTRYTALIIYLGTVGLYTFLVIGEVLTPSLDANIGLGGAILLMRLVSTAGLIFVAISLWKRVKKSFIKS